MTLRDMAIALLVMAIWGLNFAVYKIGLQQFPPLLLMTLRFAGTALCLVPFVRPPRGQWLHFLVLSLTLGSVHYGLMVLGLSKVDASTAAIAIQLQVPFAALLAAIFLDDRLGWRRTAGMVVAFLGIVLIAGEPKIGVNLVALFMVIGAAFIWAIANLHIKIMTGRLPPDRARDIDGFVLNGWIAALAAPQLLLLSLAFEDGHMAAMAAADWRGWGSIVFMILPVTILAYGLWYWLLRRHPVNQTMPWTLLGPVFGVVSGVVVLGETLTWRIVLGGAITILGVAVIVLYRPKLAEATTPTAQAAEDRR